MCSSTRTLGLLAGLQLNVWSHRRKLSFVDFNDAECKIISFKKYQDFLAGLKDDLAGCVEDAEIILEEMRVLSAGFDRARVLLSELVALQDQHSADHDASFNGRESALYVNHLESLACETSSLPALRRLQNEVEEVFVEWTTLARQAERFYKDSIKPQFLQTSEITKLQSESRALLQEAQAIFGEFLVAKDWFYELRHASQKPTESSQKTGKKGTEWHFRRNPKPPGR